MIDAMQWGVPVESDERRRGVRDLSIEPPDGPTCAAGDDGTVLLGLGTGWAALVAERGASTPLERLVAATGLPGCWSAAPDQGRRVG